MLFHFSLPNIRILSPNNEHKAMIPTMGKGVFAFKVPTAAADNAPNPICNAPIKAEALPAFLVKGAMHKAAELGKQKP